MFYILYRLTSELQTMLPKQINRVVQRPLFFCLGVMYMCWQNDIETYQQPLSYACISYVWQFVHTVNFRIMSHIIRRHIIYLT